MKKIFFGILFSVFLPNFVMGAPQIDNLNGIVSNGEIITINGSGFGEKNQAMPIRFDDFDNLVVGNGVSEETGWWVNRDFSNNNMLVSDEYSVSGSNSAKAYQAWGQDNPQLFKNNVGFADTKKIFISFWFRWRWPVWTNGTPYEALQYKLWRLASFVDSGGNVIYPSLHNFNWDGAGYNWHPLNLSYSVASGLGSVQQNFPNDSFEENNWHNITLLVNQGNKGLADGFYKAYLSKLDSPYVTVGNTNPLMIIDSQGDYINSIKLDNYIDANNANIISMGATVANPGIYFDDIYIDNSLARIEMGDASIYDQCTKRIVQIPNEWSDNSIDFFAKSDLFSDGENAYLYVFNDDGVSNQIGFPLTINSLDIFAPLPPSGLDVL